MNLVNYIYLATILFVIGGATVLTRRNAIIVYTGAILMLFLFVLMLVGVDASDSLVETIKAQRLLAVLAGLAFGLLLVVGVAQVSVGAAGGLDAANGGGNVQGLANLLFSDYVFAFEATSALLITAAIGAMVLAHRERLSPRPTQAQLAARRMQEWVETGKPLVPLPAPGVYARHNAVDTPALLPDGTPAESSVSRVLAARGTIRRASTLADDIEELTREMRTDGVIPPSGEGESAPAAEDGGDRA